MASRVCSNPAEAAQIQSAFSCPSGSMASTPNLTCHRTSISAAFLHTDDEIKAMSQTSTAGWALTKLLYANMAAGMKETATWTPNGMSYTYTSPAGVSRHATGKKNSHNGASLMPGWPNTARSTLLNDALGHIITQWMLNGTAKKTYQGDYDYFKDKHPWHRFAKCRTPSLACALRQLRYGD